MNLEEIDQIIKTKLSEKRYFHSRCVMERCEEIAKQLNFDVEIAKKVGLAHDIAKEIPNEQKVEYAENCGIIVDEIEKENPTLLHAKIGEYIVINELGFTKEMGRAIRAHTTGIENMDLLAKILFIADRTSKERGFEDIDYINDLLKENIDKAVLYIFDKKIMLQIEKKAQMHPETITARNWLLKNGNL